MAKLRIQLNHAGVRALLKQPAVAAILEAKGQAIANQAGPGHEVETFYGKNRVRVTVRTETFEAMQAEASDHRLTRAIDAGRG